jgi:hypothetical protein
MTDLADQLAVEAAQQIVTALVSGLIDLAKKVPSLWGGGRGGKEKQDVIGAEVERSRAALLAAGDDLPLARARQEGLWEGRLRDLLAEDPGAAAGLRDLLAEIRRQERPGPAVVQDVTASAPGAIAQGAVFGNVINYGAAIADEGHGR